jgi:hypothetical protein
MMMMRHMRGKSGMVALFGILLCLGVGVLIGSQLMPA